MKKWNVIGILAVMVIGVVLMSGCTQDNSKYCAETYPGEIYNATSKMCEHTPAPVTIAATMQAPVVTTEIPTTEEVTTEATIAPSTATTPASDPIEHRYIRQYINPQSNQLEGYEFRFYPGGTLRYRNGLTKMVSGNIIIDTVKIEGSGTWEALGDNKYLLKYLPIGFSGAPIIVEYTLVPAHEEVDYPGVMITEHIESETETKAIKEGEEHKGVMYYPERAKID
jgi:hypothetical protein